MAVVNIGGTTGYVRGSDCTGSDGTKNRTLVLPYTDVTARGMQVFVNGVYAHYGVDYTLSDYTLTFLNELFDDQYISGTYTTGYSSSEDVDYCTPDDVWQELDGKSSSDISEARVVDAIQQAEGLIDSKTNTFFKEVTVTDEVHTGDRYSLDVSPDYLDTLSPGVNSRRDSSSLGRITNRVKTNINPVISITSLSVNSAGGSAADDWAELTEQEGSSGSFVLEDKESGIIDFLSDYPRLGKRSWKVTYVCGHDPDSSDRKVLSRLLVVKRLCVLLACRHILTTKSSGSLFNTNMDVKIGSIEIKSGSLSSKVYLGSIMPEIGELWKQLGELGVEVV